MIATGAYPSCTTKIMSRGHVDMAKSMDRGKTAVIDEKLRRQNACSGVSRVFTLYRLLSKKEE